MTAIEAAPCSSTRVTPRGGSAPTAGPRSAAARPCGPTSRTRSGTTGAGSSSNRVNELADIEQILELTDEEREGLSAPDKFRVDVTPYFISLIDPEGSRTTRSAARSSRSGRELHSFTGMMED